MDEWNTEVVRPGMFHVACIFVECAVLGGREGNTSYREDSRFDYVAADRKWHTVSLATCC